VDLVDLPAFVIVLFRLDADFPSRARPVVVECPQTCLHELAHWTGAKHRLDRTDEKGPFGSPEYAKEEIRADLASLFLSAELGIPYDPSDQAAYIRNWIQALKNDKNEVFRAAS
jgi:antirestriction protein ArdC